MLLIQLATAAAVGAGIGLATALLLAVAIYLRQLKSSRIVERASRPVVYVHGLDGLCYRAEPPTDETRHLGTCAVVFSRDGVVSLFEIAGEARPSQEAPSVELVGPGGPTHLNG